MKCSKAMWFGNGMPAGTCNEEAFGPAKEYSYQWWRSPSSEPRCPQHGGPKEDGTNDSEVMSRDMFILRSR